ncbi:ATP:cob(I)alamin adenosyltransferase [Pararoseomonas indoligenes]|uniref:ATP:cob(I)alamin adenosyltransferase n=1 Tax=Roseomonas indoligenes TaxID=2820811 RepID=UPI003158D941
MNADLVPLRAALLPGGTPAAAHAHLARTLARRAERAVVALAETGAIGPAAVPYLNRLSDHLFVLARSLNMGQDSQWEPGGND